MAMTIVEAPPGITGGVDTHLDTHFAAALDPLGRLVGTESFPADAAGYKALFGWLESFGEVTKVGVEGTGSYGVGLARFLRRKGIEVIEVDRPNRRVDGATTASPIPSMPSKQPEPPSVAGRQLDRRSPKTVPSRRSGSSSSPSVRLDKPGSRPSTRCATW
jgi:hypothetical protein